MLEKRKNKFGQELCEISKNIIHLWSKLIPYLVIILLVLPGCVHTWTAGRSEQGGYFTILAVRVRLTNIDVAIEGLQGHSLKGMYWDFKLAKLNSLDIFISVNLTLWNLPEILLREKGGSFDRIFKGRQWRKPQCQVYAHWADPAK